MADSPQFELSFALTMSELRFAVLRNYLRHRRYAMTLAIPLIPVLFVVKNQGNSPVKIIVVVAISYLTLVPLRLWLIVSRTIKQAGSQRRLLTLTFKEDWLISGSSEDAAINSWFVYSDLSETNKYLFLNVRNTKRSIMIPKRVFGSPDECATFVAHVREWIATATPGKLQNGIN